MADISQPSERQDAPKRIEIGDPADYVVLLLDFLGHEHLLERWKVLKDHVSLGEQNRRQGADDTVLGDAIKNSAGVVALHLINITEYLLRKGLYGQTGAPPDYQLKCIQFSDTLVFYARVEPRVSVGDQGLFLINAAIMAAANVMLISLAEGQTPVRGALAIGPAVELVRDASKDTRDDWSPFLYGPVLQRVHELEDKFSDYPRILADRSVTNYLEGAKRVFRSPSQLDQNYRKILDNMLQLLAGGVDPDEREALGGFRVLDWAGSHFHEMVTCKERAGTANLLRKAMEFARSERSRAMEEHARTGSQSTLKVAGKYARLVNYLESRWVHWQSEFC